MDLCWWPVAYYSYVVIWQYAKGWEEKAYSSTRKVIVFQCTNNGYCSSLKIITQLPAGNSGLKQATGLWCYIPWILVTGLTCDGCNLKAARKPSADLCQALRHGMIKQEGGAIGVLVCHGRTVALPGFICTGSVSTYMLAGSWHTLTIKM